MDLIPAPLGLRADADQHFLLDAGTGLDGGPGTEGVQQWMPVFRKLTRPIIRTPDQGADTIVWLGAAPEPLGETGLFWHDRRPRPTHYRLGASLDSEADRQALWAYCVQALAAAGIDAGGL